MKSLCKLRAGAKAVSKSPQSTAGKSDFSSALHDGMADPEVYKHVEITKQLVTLFGVAKTDQVLAILVFDTQNM